MKIERIVVGMIGIALAAASPGIAATMPSAPGVPIEMVITARAVAPGGRPESLKGSDLTVFEGNTRVPVVRLQPLPGDLADMQLFVLLDDSTRSSSLGIQLPALRTFLESLPAKTQTAVGYMRNGTFTVAQGFTQDHCKAAGALHLPTAIPGENGSPYFALSDLAEHWPSKRPAARRAVLMLTDGVDRYFGTAIMDDPYVDAAIRDALSQGVMVYSIYLRGAGVYGGGDWAINVAQSHLLDVGQETGGYAYFQGLTDPVTISPFLSDFQNRLENQYRLTIEALNEKGVQPVKLRTDLPGLRISGPTRIYVR